MVAVAYRFILVYWLRSVFCLILSFRFIFIVHEKDIELYKVHNVPFLNGMFE